MHTQFLYGPNAMSVWVRRFTAAVTIAAGCLLGAAASAAPEAKIWPRWQTHDPGSTLVVDHSAWTAILARHLRADAGGVNRFAYGKARATDRETLADYIASLETAPVSRLNRRAQKAFWINLYNALTVKTVVDRYPVKSIRDIDISPGLLADGPWGRKLVTVEGVALSLDDIEHRILRPGWRDPRVHYAVNCAALGCPDLQPEAFTADNLEAMLDKAARAFVNSPRGATIEDGRLRVSSIYIWFKADFGGSDTTVIQHLNRHARPDLVRELAMVTGISGHQYDWTLNDAQ